MWMAHQCWWNCRIISSVCAILTERAECSEFVLLTQSFLQCLHVPVHFPSDLFLPSCSVGVVCPSDRQSNITNMSVIPYQLVQSFLKSAAVFPKYSSSLGFAWSCLNCRLQPPTLPPQFPVPSPLVWQGCHHECISVGILGSRSAARLIRHNFAANLLNL